MDVQRVDGLNWVRSKQAQLFATGRVNPMGLLAYIVADVLELGHGECRIVQNAAWWFVSSNIDWMIHPTILVPILFQRVVAAPEHGEHSLRSEVILNAFATDLTTGASGERLIVKGAPPEDELLRVSVDSEWSRRFVAFRL